MLSKYMKAYATIMNNQKPIRSDGRPGRGIISRFHYIDAFSGPGEWIVQDKGIESYLNGSPVLAIKCDPPFDRVWFIEKDPKRTVSLERMIADEGSRDRARVLCGDANERIREVSSQINKDERGLVFLDPYGLDVEWKTIRLLAKREIFDVFINFSIMGIIRNTPKDGEQSETFRERLRRVVGDPGWVDDLYVGQPDMFGNVVRRRARIRPTMIAAKYQQQLATEFRFVSRYVIMRNSRNGPMYALLLASPKEVAFKIMNDIMERYKFPYTHEKVNNMTNDKRTRLPEN